MTGHDESISTNLIPSCVPREWNYKEYKSVLGHNEVNFSSKNPYASSTCHEKPPNMQTIGGYPIRSVKRVKLKVNSPMKNNMLTDVPGKLCGLVSKMSTGCFPCTISDWPKNQETNDNVVRESFASQLGIPWREALLPGTYTYINFRLGRTWMYIFIETGKIQSEKFCEIPTSKDQRPQRRCSTALVLFGNICINLFMFLTG